MTIAHDTEVYYDPYDVNIVRRSVSHLRPPS